MVGDLIWEMLLDLVSEPGKVRLDDVPDDLVAHGVIAVDQHVAKADDPAILGDLLNDALVSRAILLSASPMISN